MQDYHRAMELVHDAGTRSDGVQSLRAALRSPALAEILPEAQANLGTALSMLGRRAEALAAFGTSLRLRPNVGLTHYNRAALLGNDANVRVEAIAHYKSAIAFAPTFDSAHNNLGNLLIDAQRPKEAAACFHGALRANPRFALAYNNLANLAKDGTEAGDRAAGLQYSHAVRLSPQYTEAYRNLGNLLKERQAWRHAAIAAYRVALQLAPSHLETLMNLGETLGWLGRDRAANLTYVLAVQRGVWTHPQQRPSHFIPGLRASPWWPTATYRWVRRLLDGFATLREEGLSLLHSSGFDRYLSPALTEGSWSDVTLAMSGMRQPGAARAPRSYALLASLGEEVLSMVSGSAYFSVLAPGSRLRPHCGPSNTRLRLHVGLSVSGNAGIRVGNESRHWREGEALLFDDSFEHEVWNEGDAPRLIFIVDAWHPDLDTEQRRRAVLDAISLAKYDRALHDLRLQGGLTDAPDLVADRRKRVYY